MLKYPFSYFCLLFYTVMKSQKWLLGLILFSICGCKNDPPVEQLADSMPVFSEVYALKDYHPDSAKCIMDNIADTLDESMLRQRSAFLYNEYQVLKTEIRYKNFYSVKNDSATLDAFRFYDSVISKSRKAAHDETLQYQYARSLYYKAAIESHRGMSTESFDDFLQSLHAIDKLAGNLQPIHFKDPKPEYEHLTALVYDRLAWFFYNYDEWNEALECLNHSNDHFEKEGCDEGIASNFELMGDVMLAQGDRYSSLDYYRKSDSIYTTIGIDNSYLHYNMLLHDALELYNANKKEECNNLLIDALNTYDQSSRIAKQTHFTLGYFNFENQKYDSALYHYERSYPLLPRQTLKSYCRAVMSANALGDTLKAGYYGQLLAELTTQRFYQKSDVAKMTTSYQKYNEEKDIIVGRRLFLYVIAFIALLALIITSQSLWIHRRRRRAKADQEQHERMKTSLEEKIAQTNAELNVKEEKISTLQTELDKAIANPDFQNLPFNDRLNALMQMPICKRALKVQEYNVKAGVSYPELVMSENQMGQLVNAIDAVFPKFSVKIIEQYPRLKRSDVIYCSFYILGLSEIQAAVLTGKTYQAVWKRSTKLHEVFGNKSSLQFILHNIIKNW